MGKEKSKKFFTKTLAVIGTTLVWLPIAVPLFFTLILLIKERIFRFDFLMPAELFPLALTGGAILVWVSRNIKVYRTQVLSSYLCTLLFLVGSQVMAVLTGLASGKIEPSGWPLILVMTIFVLYIISHIALGVTGLLLLRYNKTGRFFG